MVDYQVIIRNRTNEIEWEQWYQQCGGSDNTTNSSDHKSIAYEWECNPAFMMILLLSLGCILFCASIILAGVYVWDTTIIKKSCVWKRRSKSRKQSQEEQTRTDDDGSMVITHSRHCYDINNDDDSGNDSNTNEPTQPKFEKWHETIIFVSKWCFLLVIYDVLVVSLLLETGTVAMRRTSAITSAWTLALVGYAGVAWYIKPSCMNKKTPIQLQAADIFQDFVHTSTVVAVSSGIVQSILLLVFISSIFATLHSSYIKTFKITNQTSITDNEESPNLHYTTYQVANQYYLLASLFHATYAVGMNDIFSAVHSYFDFWLDTYYYWYHNNFYSTCTSWFWFGTGQNTGKKKLICNSNESSSSSSPSSSRSISFFALAIRSLLGLFLNVFGQVFLTLLLPLRLAFSKNAFDFVLNATAALVIVQLVYLPNIEHFTLSTSTSLRPREEEEAAAAADNDDDIANVGMTPPAYKHKKMISIAHHGRRGLARGRGRRGMMNDTADGIAAIPYRYSKFILDRNSGKMNNIAGIEFREYPKYKYIEYDQPQAMKDVMKRHRNRGYTPLNGFSHSITSAKLLSSRKKGEGQPKLLYQTTKITQPIQDPITTNNDVSSSILVDVKDTECTQLIAVASLSNPWFNYAYQHDVQHARREDMLSYADTELRFALQKDFGLILQPPVPQANRMSESLSSSSSLSSSPSTVMTTSESTIIKSRDTMTTVLDNDDDVYSEQNVVFVKYDALSEFDARIGEVWITITNDADIKKIHDCNMNNVADSSSSPMIMDDNTV